MKIRKTKMIGFYFATLAAIITFVLYLPALQNMFIKRDDIPYILANQHIRSLDANFFKWAFVDFYSANWHPLTWMSHAIDYALWGLNPTGHHLTSIILHAINTFLVVLLAKKLINTWQKRAEPHSTTQLSTEREALIASVLTGLLFGLHPVHVESVAWVAERKDVLCALFFLLSVSEYIKYTDAVYNKDLKLSRLHYFNKYYLYSIAFFALALLSKPMAVSLPVVIILLDWFPLERIRSRKDLLAAFIEKLPFIVLSFISSILTILAQRSGMAMELMNAVPLHKRLIVAAKSLISYLKILALPVDLVPFYSYPRHISLSSAEYSLAIVSIVGITIFSAAIVKRHKLLFSVWVYYVVTLMPVLGIIQVGEQSIADRYAYIPSIGIFLAVSLMLTWGLKKVSSLMRMQRLLITGGVTLICIIFAALSSLTYKQIHVWKDDISLWTHVIETQREPNLLAFTSRSMDYFNLGQYDKAIADFTSVISLDPSGYLGYFYRGLSYRKVGAIDNAIEDFDKSIALNPYFVDAYLNRGIAYGDTGQFNKAVKDCDSAISLDPANHSIYNIKGAFYGKANMPLMAIQSFSKAISLSPTSADSFYNRGIAFASLKEYGKALEDFSRSIEINKSDALSYFSRGKVYMNIGNKKLANADFQQACNLGYKDSCNALTNSSQ